MCVKQCKKSMVRMTYFFFTFWYDILFTYFHFLQYNSDPQCCLDSYLVMYSFWKSVPQLLSQTDLFWGLRSFSIRQSLMLRFLTYSSISLCKIRSFLYQRKHTLCHVCVKEHCWVLSPLKAFIPLNRQCHPIEVLVQILNYTMPFLINTCFCHQSSIWRLCVGMKKRVTEMQNFDHKYLISIDGNSFAARLSRYLASASLIFRAGMFDEWYEEWLQDGVHYVRVALDYSDLSEKLKWAKENDAQAKKIALQSRFFATNHLRREDMECYWYRLLLEYANILDL